MGQSLERLAVGERIIHHPDFLTDPQKRVHKIAALEQCIHTTGMPFRNAVNSTYRKPG